ncbi:MAG: hypothetical protein H6704_13515 [Myxococcales bacterium]|nr:hypothetical protein [Myxococcales bacterium]
MDWLTSDTSPDVERVLIEGYRRMTPAERGARLGALTIAAQRLALAGIRARHGDLPEHQLRLRLAALWLPRELMIEVFHWDSEKEGY